MEVNKHEHTEAWIKGCHVNNYIIHVCSNNSAHNLIQQLSTSQLVNTFPVSSFKIIKVNLHMARNKPDSTKKNWDCNQNLIYFLSRSWIFTEYRYGFSYFAVLTKIPSKKHNNSRAVHMLAKLGCWVSTVLSSLSNHASLSSAVGQMSGRSAALSSDTHRRDNSSPGEPIVVEASFTCRKVYEIFISIT